MKKILLTFVAVMATTLASAQVRPYLTVGTQGVYITPSKDYDGLEDTKSAFRLGLGCYVPVAKNLFVVPELSYSQFKFHENGWIGGGSLYSPEYRCEQLHLPVVADYWIKCTDWLSVDIGAGPFVNYVLNSDAAKKMNFHRFNSGLALRATVRVPYFSLGVSYDWGMTNIRDENNQKLSMLGVNVGVSF